MSSHPLNSALRFLLEIASLVIFGIWGWYFGNGIWAYLLALGFPLLAASIWGVFAVRDDPSRSGKTIIQTPGILRLIIELTFFGIAGWALFSIDFEVLAIVFCLFVLIHYLISFNRIIWLLKQ